MTETVAILGGIVAIAATLLTFYTKMNAKHSRIYQRIDETRETMYQDCRTKEVCDERHAGVSDQLSCIRTDITEIKKDVKNLVQRSGGNI